MHGESIVMRILDKQGLMLGLPKLGFLSDDQQTFERLITVRRHPAGDRPHRFRQDDHPVRLPESHQQAGPQDHHGGGSGGIPAAGINQVHVRTEIGLTFGAALRSILRQAPNIIMIGEIRDMETAEIAVNASLTGHLVFSTLHTNDAPSAVTRLIDIGVKPFLVASSSAASWPSAWCARSARSARPPSITDMRAAAARAAGPAVAPVPCYHRGGCADCNHTGFRGRIGIFEIFVINDEVRHMIYEQRLRLQLRAEGARAGHAHPARGRPAQGAWPARPRWPKCSAATMGDAN
jgi:type IV pilus assembly protein PilB